MSEGARIRARLQGFDAFHWFEEEHHGERLTDRDLEQLEERALAVGISLEVALERTRYLFAGFVDMPLRDQEQIANRIASQIRGSLH